MGKFKRKESLETVVNAVMAAIDGADIEDVYVALQLVHTVLAPQMKELQDQSHGHIQAQIQAQQGLAGNLRQ